MLGELFFVGMVEWRRGQIHLFVYLNCFRGSCVKVGLSSILVWFLEKLNQVRFIDFALEICL